MLLRIFIGIAVVSSLTTAEICFDLKKYNEKTDKPISVCMGIADEYVCAVKDTSLETAAGHYRSCLFTKLGIVTKASKGFIDHTNFVKRLKRFLSETSDAERVKKLSECDQYDHNEYLDCLQEPERCPDVADIRDDLTGSKVKLCPKEEE